MKRNFDELCYDLTCPKSLIRVGNYFLLNVGYITNKIIKRFSSFHELMINLLVKTTIFS